jgi:hypothetical protein
MQPLFCAFRTLRTSLFRFGASSLLACQHPYSASMSLNLRSQIRHEHAVAPDMTVDAQRKRTKY